MTAVTKRRSESDILTDNVDYQLYINQLVLPGMVLRLRNSEKNVTWSFGPGLTYIPKPNSAKIKNHSRLLCESVLIQRFGILRQIVKSTNEPQPRPVPTRQVVNQCLEYCIWLEGVLSYDCASTLLPLSRTVHRFHINQFQINDHVIGVVVRKAGENFIVDIGCATRANLHYLSFEGASKKNRPDIQIGDVIYALIARADRDLEIDLSCVDEVGKSSGMGILGRYEPGTVGNAGGSPGGIMLHCSQDVILRLMKQDEFPYLQLLSKVFPFEICLGVNGRIWLTTRSPRETMLLANAIAIADHIPADECLKLVKDLC